MVDPKYFIVIDDDAINNKICRTVIEKIYKDSDVNTFTDPIQGFEFIVSEYSKPGNNNSAILFLDINMPVMDAWDFLALFDRLADELRHRITIFILSSSVNKADMERAMSNRNVSYYLIKPLTKESIKLITNLTIKKKTLSQDAPASASAPQDSQTRTAEAEALRNKKEAEERDAKLKSIRIKDELVHREIPDLEKNLNGMLYEIEKRYAEYGLFVEPVTVGHGMFDKRKGGKLQLNIHFFEGDKDNLHIMHDSSKLSL